MTRTILQENVVTQAEIEKAEKKLSIAGLGSVEASMILAEMVVQKLTCQAIGKCEAYLHLASIMLQILPAEILDTEMPAGNEGMFQQMKGARNHLKQILESK